MELTKFWSCSSIFSCLEAECLPERRLDPLFELGCYLETGSFYSGEYISKRIPSTRVCSSSSVSSVSNPLAVLDAFGDRSKGGS